ncbi:MAG: glycosyltransferase family 2 protein [Rhodospirillaceae bacterium]|nr:glycosyltransferase family 2 protein [Rhodospirillaceae bacterium]
MTGACDISIVLAAHDEGMMLHPTLRSAARACARAEAAGLAVELVAILDSPSPATRAYFEDWTERGRQPAARRHETAFRDLGLVRNFGITQARGRYVALLDGDDLWCAEWLAAAHRAAEADPRRTIWHPEYSVMFGESAHVMVGIDMDDPQFRLPGLALENHWTALAFAARDIFLETPYRPAAVAAGFGFEDWAWNCDTIARGARHKIVPGTSHFIRKKQMQDSLSLRMTEAACLPIPSALFRLDGAPPSAD